MTATDWSMLAAVLVAVVVSWIKNPGLTKKALKIGYKSFIKVLPFFVVVFAAIGLFEVLLSPETVGGLLGSSMGIGAPLIAASLGGVASGPPAAVYPIGRFLLDQHASVTAVATLLTAWVMVGTVSLPAEIAYMGRRFALVRWAVAFIFSMIIGISMGWLL
ncbi:MAG: hypothetical protein JJD96_04050 [Thermoleophilia bacterium]|nr:hypothetical protein [Thermoleophilia bacterium]